MEIGRCLNETLEVYKRNLAQLVVAAFLFELLSVLSLSVLMEASAYLQEVDEKKPLSQLG